MGRTVLIVALVIVVVALLLWRWFLYNPRPGRGPSFAGAPAFGVYP